MFAAVAHAAEPIVATSLASSTESAKRLISKKGTRDQVVAHLGMPDAMLSHDLWIYWNFQINQPDSKSSLDTLVVAFERNRIVGLRITSSAFLRELFAEQAKRSPANGLRDPLYIVKEK